MENKCENQIIPLVKTVTNWHAARSVFSAFIAAHPELGLKDTPVTFRNFCYRYGAALRELGVMRKPSGLRSPAIIDISKFDAIAFEFITNPDHRLKFEKSAVGKQINKSNIYKS
jgi:hypothetical protein